MKMTFLNIHMYVSISHNAVKEREYRLLVQTKTDGRIINWIIIYCYITDKNISTTYMYRL